MGGIISDVVRRGDDGNWRFVIDNASAGAMIGAGRPAWDRSGGRRGCRIRRQPELPEETEVVSLGPAFGNSPALDVEDIDA